VTVPDHKITSGWLGEPPATDAEFASAEQRLGVLLPTPPIALFSQRATALTASAHSSTGSRMPPKSNGSAFVIRIGSTRGKAVTMTTFRQRNTWPILKTVFSEVRISSNDSESNSDVAKKPAGRQTQRDSLNVYRI
jgi:hypothetical protein